MTDYMTADDRTDPFEETDLDVSRTEAVRRIPDGVEGTKERIIQNVEKLHRTVSSRGDLGTVEKPARECRTTLDNASTDHNVVEACVLPEGGGYSREYMYYIFVAPVATTSGELEWKSAYQLDPTEAVEPGGEAFQEATEEFNIRTENRSRKLVPGYIYNAYEYLSEKDRPVHKWELLHELGPVLTKNGYRVAFDYIERLPGVEPPAQELAWNHTPETETASTSGSGSGEAAVSE